MDLASLAAGTVAVLQRLWDAAAAEAAKKAAQDLYGWLKGKLTGAAAESLAELEAEPAKERNAERLKADLEELLEQDRGLAEALAPKLEAARRAIGVAQRIEQTGDRNVAVQAVGSSVRIER